MSSPETTAAAFEHILWPRDQIGRLLPLLAEASGLAVSRQERMATAVVANDDEWIPAAGQLLGIDIVSEDLRYQHVDVFVRTAAPAILRIDSNGAFIALLKSRKRVAEVLAPDGTIRKVPLQIVSKLVRRASDDVHGAAMDALLGGAGIDESRRAQARAFLLGERLAFQPVARTWRLERPASAGLLRHFRDERLPRSLVAFATLYGLHYALLILAWALVGKWGLDGHPQPGWTSAWLLLMLTMVPMQLSAAWMQGIISLRIGATLKRLLLSGVLKSNADSMRASGPSEHLARVLEATVVESMILSAGFLGVTGTLELLVAGLVLAAGATGGWHVVLLAGWMLLFLAVNALYFRRRRAATRIRIGMTHDLVERMVGYRTVLAQEPAHLRHTREDGTAASYYQASQSMDRVATTIEALMSHGWTAVAVAVLGGFIVAGVRDPLSIALTIGGVLLAERGMLRFTTASTQTVDAAIAWKQVTSILAASRATEPAGSLAFAGNSEASSSANDPLLTCRNAVFRYRAGAEPVVKHWTLHIGARDRILFEGASGSGKSTFASLLAGLRPAESGAILLRGLDLQTLGERSWRKRVVNAPQFHENHVFAESFAFNLLLGTRWPPSAAALQEAEQICREIGLGDLLDRMPGRMFQMVGDTGWQLSHGEKSRLYIARALLQKPALLILDESFAALDPENFSRTLDTVLARSAAVLVIAHP